jgi:hypothetical protein
MQIQLKQPEIEEAIIRYISQQGISLVGKTITVNFTSGRKDNGLSADVDIDNVKDATPEPQEGTTGKPNIFG